MVSKHRTIEVIEALAAYLDEWLKENSDYVYEVPQNPRISASTPVGVRFGVLILPAPFSNEIAGGDSKPYSDRLTFDIFGLVNEGGSGDFDTAYWQAIAMDEITQALRDDAEIGDPPFGIEEADEDRVEGGEYGRFNDSAAIHLTASLLYHTEY